MSNQAYKALESVADAATKGESVLFVAAAEQLVSQGQLTKAFGCACGETYTEARYADNCNNCHQYLADTSEMVTIPCYVVSDKARHKLLYGVEIQSDWTDAQQLEARNDKSDLDMDDGGHYQDDF